jgi:hypothetical protein
MFNDNQDFYPTPLKVINKMLSKIDFRTIRSVLEPSAGKGDLVESIKKKFDYHHNSYNNKKNYDIDTIEIDNNLQYILQGKQFRLVHDDYLTYNSFKKYDLICMNPPFSQGDKHLLKAIEMQQEGGQIVAILNAETLKNPYSNSRKELIRKLEQYNATVDYIENAFTDSERKTNVEIALIHIDIPKIQHNSIILDELKQTETSKTEKQYNSDKLINSDFITGIVEQYNHEVKAGLKLIDEYNALKPYMLRGFNDNSSPVLKLELEYKDESSTLENAYIKQIRQKYWSTLFSNDQFMGLFTSNLRQKYMQHVEELKDYDFSFYNIYTLRIQISKEMVQGVEDTILNLFEEFSYKHYFAEGSKNVHYYNGWATNKSYKINKKVIIPLNGFCDMQYSWGRYEPTHYRILDKLKDIEKVFVYLDSEKTEDIDIVETLKMAEHYGETKKIELRYFFVSFFKKGTTHLEFKNNELLAKFNLFAAKNKMWIPGNFGKTSYSDMSKDERDVVDSFCGKEEYSKILNNSEYYLYEPSEILLLTGVTAS